MYATVCLSVLVSATLCVASPYYAPQQRQLFYSAVPSVVPQYPQYSQYAQFPAYQPYPQYTPVAPAPAAFKQYYYAPHTAANLVAPGLRYPAAVAPAKQVVYYPGAVPYPLLAGDDNNAEAAPGWGSSILSSFNNAFPALGNYFGSTTPSESASGPAAPAAPVAPEQPTKEGDKVKDTEKEGDEVKPEAENKLKAAPAPQKYVLVGQPQFYGLQPANPAAVIPSAQHGAVSSYLLLKNYPGVRFAAPIPQVPQVPQIQQVPQQPADAELIPAGSPGKAALSYFKLLQDAQNSRQQKEYEDSVAVTVDADDTKDEVQDDDKEATNQEAADSDVKEDEEPGTKE